MTTFVFVGQVYDPPLVPTFNLHFEDLVTGIIFTFRIDPSSPTPRKDFAIHMSEPASTPIRGCTYQIPSTKGLSFHPRGTQGAWHLGSSVERYRVWNPFLKFYAPKEVFSFDYLGLAVVDVDVGRCSGRVLVARHRGVSRKTDLFVVGLES